MAEHDQTRQAGYPHGGPAHAPGPAEAFKPGSMDIRNQEQTFAAFITWTARALVGIAVVFVFLAIFAR